MNYVYPGIQEEFTGTRDNLSETITIEFSFNLINISKELFSFTVKYYVTRIHDGSCLQILNPTQQILGISSLKVIRIIQTEGLLTERIQSGKLDFVECRNIVLVFL